MTIICYRDGVMASDSQLSDCGVYVGDVKKIARASDGTLAGCSGDRSNAYRFLQWVDAGMPDEFEVKPGNSGLVALLVKPDLTVWRAVDSGGFFPVDAKFHAEGVGRHTAMGAMAAGATAEEAVAIAIQFEDGCGGAIQIERLSR